MKFAFKSFGLLFIGMLLALLALSHPGIVLLTGIVLLVVWLVLIIFRALRLMLSWMSLCPIRLLLTVVIVSLSLWVFSWLSSPIMTILR